MSKNLRKFCRDMSIETLDALSLVEPRNIPSALKDEVSELKDAFRKEPTVINVEKPQPAVATGSNNLLSQSLMLNMMNNQGSGVGDTIQRFCVWLETMGHNGKNNATVQDVVVFLAAFGRAIAGSGGTERGSALVKEVMTASLSASVSQALQNSMMSTQLFPQRNTKYEQYKKSDYRSKPYYYR